MISGAFTRRKKSTFDELTMYLACPVVNFKSKEDYLNFLKEIKSVYPQLYKVASKYLCLVATYVPSECLFSKAGATFTQSRNRLLGKRLGKLLFLSSLPEEDRFQFFIML